MTRQEQASYYFEHGCTCSQAVLLAFSDVTGLEETTAMRLAAPFGGGMGRLREVCGAVSGMLMALGALSGSESVLSQAEKGALYADVQALAARFREENGSIICRELLAAVKPSDDPLPEERTPQYYQKRSCARLCGCAAALLEHYIKEKETK